MKRVGWILLVAVLVAVVSVLVTRRPLGEPRIPVASVKEEPAKRLPQLLEPRVATVENPSQSWERLLARDGTPQEDRAALADLVTNFLQAAPVDRRPAMGANEEITRALTSQDELGEAALPKNHPAIIDGKLVDRWGNPWFFHQEAADVIDVRSAGPDGELFTSDDVIK